LDGSFTFFLHVGLVPEQDGLGQGDEEDECGNQQPIDQQTFAEEGRGAPESGA
jgi:hypothetical protein